MFVTNYNCIMVETLEDRVENIHDFILLKNKVNI